MFAPTYKGIPVQYRTDKRGLLIVLDDQRLVRVSAAKKKVKLRLIDGHKRTFSEG